jgi:hypothetical protein
MRNALAADRLPWHVNGMEVLDAKGDFVAMTEDVSVAKAIAAASVRMVGDGKRDGTDEVHEGF